MVVRIGGTVPIRVRSSVAQALRELGEADAKMSDVASFLLVIAILDTEQLAAALTPETQRALTADLLDIFGDVLKTMAVTAIQEGWTWSEMFKKIKK